MGPLRWGHSVVSGSLRGVGLPPWFRSRKERDKEIKKWSGCCGKRHCFACSRGVRMDGSAMKLKLACAANEVVGEHTTLIDELYVY